MSIALILQALVTNTTDEEYAEILMGRIRTGKSEKRMSVIRAQSRDAIISHLAPDSVLQ